MVVVLIVLGGDCDTMGPHPMYHWGRHSESLFEWAVQVYSKKAGTFKKQSFEFISIKN